MNKEEYIKKISELEHTRQKALEYNRREKEKLSKQFTEENCKLKVGDMVVLDGKRGVIEEINVSEYGRFFGEWRKSRKDGKPFAMANHFGSFDYDNMVKVESNN